jgi:hypothetical protein
MACGAPAPTSPALPPLFLFSALPWPAVRGTPAPLRWRPRPHALFCATPPPTRPCAPCATPHPTSPTSWRGRRRRAAPAGGALPPRAAHRRARLAQPHARQPSPATSQPSLESRVRVLSFPPHHRPTTPSPLHPPACAARLRPRGGGPHPPPRRHAHRLCLAAPTPRVALFTPCTDAAPKISIAFMCATTTPNLHRWLAVLPSPATPPSRPGPARRAAPPGGARRAGAPPTPPWAPRGCPPRLCPPTRHPFMIDAHGRCSSRPQRGAGHPPLGPSPWCDLGPPPPNHPTGLGWLAGRQGPAGRRLRRAPGAPNCSCSPLPPPGPRPRAPPFVALCKQPRPLQT